MKKGFFLTAEIRIKDEKNVVFAREKLSEIVVLSLAEPGCESFTIVQDDEDPTRFILWERFKSENEFEEHFNKRYVQDWYDLKISEIIYISKIKCSILG